MTQDVNRPTESEEKPEGTGPNSATAPNSDAAPATDEASAKGPAAEPARVNLPPGWEKAFTGGKDLDSIHIEIEPTRPLPSKEKTATSAPVAAGEETPGSGGEPAKPATETPRKPIRASQPAVYELDIDMAEDVLDPSGRIDWTRALSQRPRKHPSPGESRPSGPPRPATAKAPAPASSGPAQASPARPATAAPNAPDWTRLPGAEKVLRMSPSQPDSGSVSSSAPAGSSAPAAPSAPPTAPQAAPAAEGPMSRYEQLKRRPSFHMEPEAVKTANEFSEVIFHISRALQLIKKFRSDYAYLIAPNVYSVWEDNLKECSTTMLREFQHMKDPRQKQYDRKYVCKSCKSVFFVSLPDGICDECRGKMGPGGPY